jgi:hypothetical protein
LQQFSAPLFSFRALEMAFLSKIFTQNCVVWRKGQDAQMSFQEWFVLLSKPALNAEIFHIPALKILVLLDLAKISHFWLGTT